MKINWLYPLAAIFLFGSCDGLVSDNHVINQSWEFVHYRLTDGSLDSLSGYSVPILIFKNSEDVSGNGPVRNFRAEAEIYEDGEILIQNFTLVGPVQDSLAEQVDSLYFDRLEGVSRFTFDGDRLILTSEIDKIDIVYRK